jgi:hypothetical protein
MPKQHKNSCYTVKILLHITELKHSYFNLSLSIVPSHFDTLKENENESGEDKQ